MSIIPSRNKVIVIDETGDMDFSSWPVGQLPYKDENGTIQGSGLRMLSSGSLLAPVGFSVESGSIDFGDVLRLAESAGFLAFDNLIENNRYQLLDYAVPRNAPSSKPFYFKLIESEHRVGSTDGTATVTTNPISFDYETKFTARTNAIIFKANSVMENVRVKIVDKDSGVAVKYFPSKSAWLTGKDGARLEVGDNILDFQDTSVIFEAGTDITFEIQADNVALSGTSGIPKFAALVQKGVFVGVVDDNELQVIKDQIASLVENKTIKYSDLIGVPTSFTPSAHQHPTSDVIGLDDTISALSDAIESANGEFEELSVVAKTGLYKDLLDKPTIPVVDYPVKSVNGKTGGVVLSATDVGAMPVGQGIDYSQITNPPTIPAKVTNTSQLVNDSGFITTINYPVISVNGKTGAVTLTSSDVGATSVAHGHPISDIAGLQTSLDSKANANSLAGYATTSALTNGLSLKLNIPSGNTNQYLRGDGSLATFPSIPVQSVNGKTGSVVLNNIDVGAAAFGHTHVISEVNGLQAALDSKASANDLSGYATTNALTLGLAGKFNTPTGTTNQYIRGDGSTAAFPSIPAAQVNSDWSATSGVAQILNKPVLFDGTWASLTGKPTTFTPSAHTHVTADTSGLQTALDAKVDQAGARNAISVTTTGTGSASYTPSTGVLNIPAPVTRTYTNPTRTLNTAFQISATRDCMVSYSVDITVAALILAGTSGRVYLEYANETGFTTGVTVVGSTGNAIGGVLNVNNLATANLAGLIPAGKFVRLRTANVSGTPTYTFMSAQEVIL